MSTASPAAPKNAALITERLNALYADIAASAVKPEWHTWEPRFKEIDPSTGYYRLFADVVRKNRKNWEVKPAAGSNGSSSGKPAPVAAFSPKVLEIMTRATQASTASSEEQEEIHAELQAALAESESSSPTKPVRKGRDMIGVDGTRHLNLHSGVWGDFSKITKGDFANITGDVSGLEGEVSSAFSGCVTNIRGKINALTGRIRIQGDVSNITGCIDGITGDVSNVNGDVSKISGSVDNVSGTVTHLEGNVSGLKGDVSRLSGKTDGLYGQVRIVGKIEIIGCIDGITGCVDDLLGDVSGIRGDVTNINGDATNLRGDVSNIRGNISNLRGDVTNISGEVTQLEGDVSNLRGDVSGLSGDASEIIGDATGLKAYLTGLSGDITFIKGDFRIETEKLGGAKVMIYIVPAEEVETQTADSAEEVIRTAESRGTWWDLSVIGANLAAIFRAITGKGRTKRVSAPLPPVDSPMDRVREDQEVIGSGDETKS